MILIRIIIGYLDLTNKMKEKFTRKPNNIPNSRYSWSPTEYSGDKKNLLIKTLPFFIGCNATVGSQGVDNIVTYVYNEGHLAYVECNYVQ